MQGKRIMMIVWKWEDLDPKSEPVDNYFPVQKDPQSFVIRLHEYQSEQAIARLIQLIREQEADASFMLFLHRDHHYSQDQVRHFYHQLSQEERQRCKCFLFGGGNDYIYFSTREEGLLDDFGWWMNEPEYEFRPTAKGAVRVGAASVVARNADSGRWELLPRYFAKVWQFYEQELRRKVFELKQDLMAELLQGYLEQKPLDPFTPLVQARIESFCGQADRKALQALEKWGREHERTYIFEVDQMNLERQFGVDARASYQELYGLLQVSIKAEPVHYRQVPLIRNAFDRFLTEL